LKIAFLSHFGTEFYCPLSTLKVFGTTIFEDLANTHVGFHPDDNKSSEEDDEPIEVPHNFIDLSNTYPPKRKFDVQDPDRLASLLNVATVSFTPALRLNQQLEQDFKSLVEDWSAREDESAGGAQESVFKTILKRLDMVERNQRRIIYEFEGQMGTVYNDFNDSISTLYREMKLFNRGWEDVFTVYQV
jgi:hypothetical protein